MTQEQTEREDYIIVGAGSAGCVLASRLSEGPGARVLLLEAGVPDDVPEVMIPLAFPKLFKSPLDWNFETEAQAQLNNRRLYWPRGKLLGGSSSINAMIYIRGHRRDYDAWAEAGNPGWAYADVLPYFQRAEDFEGGASAWHGAGGPLHVERRRYTHAISDAFVAAAETCGYGRNDDFNGAQQDGVGRYQVTQKNGMRHSAARAYLHPALERPNLQARTGAHVTRVLLRGGRATGVEYVKDGQTHTVHAERGIILCAGAVTSPQLLMLSGIGAAAGLEAAGVAVAHDLPGVGQNLQDHLFVPLAYQTDTPGLEVAESAENMDLFFGGGSGMLVSNVAEAGGFIRTRPGLEAPDLQWHMGPALFSDHGFDVRPGSFFTLLPSLIQPASRGYIGLASHDPLRAPLIQPNYGQDPADLDLLVRGLELSREIANAAPLDPYRGEEVLPGPAARSRAELLDHVRLSAMTLYHPVGSCLMGQGEGAVVDERLRVRGLENLWVADASIMPTIVRGNTNAPTIMIGEKAADLILGRAAPSAAGAQPVGVGD